MLKMAFLAKKDGEKLSFMLSNVMLVFQTAKACQQVLHTRT